MTNSGQSDSYECHFRACEYLPPSDYQARAGARLHDFPETARKVGLVDDTSILIWAAWNLDIAVLAFRTYEIAKPDADNNVFGSKYEVVEIHAISGVFRSCVTALDLCGAFAGALTHGRVPEPEDVHPDIGSWSEGKPSQAHPLMSEWIRELQQDGEWKILEKFRHGVTHRRLRRHFSMVVGPENDRGLSLFMDDTRHESIDTLLPRMISFSGERLLDFVERVDLLVNEER